MYREQTKNLRFINAEVETKHLLKLQEKDLKAAGKWLKDNPGGINFK